MANANTTSTTGVIFDLDGTLYRMRWPKLRMILALRSDLGPLRQLHRARSTLRSRTFDTAEAFKTALYAELAGAAGIDPDRAGQWYEKKFMEAFVSMLARYGRVRPGLLPLLDALRNNGARLAVVSDYGRVGDRLNALGIPLKSFDDILSVEDFGALKPCAKPFLALAAKWRLAPGALTVVGDREDLDRASATAAGMSFIGVRKRGILIRKQNGFICWSEVAKLLKAKTGPATEC